MVFWALFVTFLPGMALVFRVVGRGNGGIAFAAGVVWMIGFAIVGYQTGGFECPRCGKPFFVKFDNRPGHQDWARKPSTRQCLHCGLPKWAERDPDR